MTNTTTNGIKRTVHTFKTSSEAWDFMRACDKRGEFAGYPSLQAPYTVEVMERAS